MAMEPHNTLASYESSGKLIVWSSTQPPYYLQLTLARILELPTNQLRVVVPFVGSEVRVVDDAVGPVPPGRIDYLLINGDSALVYYWNQQAKTKAMI